MLTHAPRPRGHAVCEAHVAPLDVLWVGPSRPGPLRRRAASRPPPGRSSSRFAFTAHADARAAPARSRRVRSTRRALGCPLGRTIASGTAEATRCEQATARTLVLP